jgi:hypothetical protein
MGENEVRTLYDNLITAWNDHDGRAMAAPFAEDGVIIGFDGSVSSGSQAIGSEMANIFADHETGRYAVNVNWDSTLRSCERLLGWFHRAVLRSIPRRTPTRALSPKCSTANGGSCSFRTLLPSSTAGRAWLRR